MTLSIRTQRLIFLLVMIGAAVCLSVRISPLLPLYTSSTVRASAKDSLVTVTEREGWLLSDMDVRAVTTENIRVIHHEHHRGEDRQTCYILLLSDHSLTPCDAKPN